MTALLKTLQNRYVQLSYRGFSVDVEALPSLELEGLGRVLRVELFPVEHELELRVVRDVLQLGVALDERLHVVPAQDRDRHRGLAVARLALQLDPLQVGRVPGIGPGLQGHGDDARDAYVVLAEELSLVEEFALLAERQSRDRVLNLLGNLAEELEKRLALE